MQLANKNKSTSPLRYEHFYLFFNTKQQQHQTQDYPTTSVAAVLECTCVYLCNLPSRGTRSRHLPGQPSSPPATPLLRWCPCALPGTWGLWEAAGGETGGGGGGGGLRKPRKCTRRKQTCIRRVEKGSYSSHENTGLSRCRLRKL